MNARKESGFTMMEILVAMALLAVVSGLSLTSITGTARLPQSQQSIASNIARGYLEQLREFVGQDRFSQNGIPLSLNGATMPSAATQVLNGTTYTTTYSVNNGTSVAVDANGEGIEDYRRVRMTVSW